VVVRAFINSFVIATLATIFSLAVTVTSGYMLSRFKGRWPSAWFGTIYVFRTIPYIMGAAALFRHPVVGHLRHLSRAAAAAHRRPHLLLFVADEGLLRRHRPVDGVAALIDGCTRWGAFLRVALPSAMPGIAALSDPVLAVDMERVPVRADPDQPQHPDPHRGDGAVRVTSWAWNGT
jgi:multiple sugar transport system permease protein